MTKGLLIHAALLVVALIFAYQTWTRVEAVAPVGGDVVVWSVPVESVEALEFSYTEAEQDERLVRVERRSDEAGEYLWGREVRSLTRYAERRDEQELQDIKPRKERVEVPREFVAGDRAKKAFEDFAELRALREIGLLDAEGLERFGLEKKDELLTVKLKDGGERKLYVGDRIYRTRDRYVLVPETGIGYVVSGETVRSIRNGESNLRISSIHIYKEEDIGKAVVEASGQTRSLVRATATDSRGREQQVWADAQTPTQPDQTMINFLSKIKSVQPSEYRPEIELSSLTPVVRVEYRRSNDTELGWVVLYQSKVDSLDPEARPAYYMRTERSRVPAVVVYSTGSEVSDDVQQLFQ